NHDTGWHDKKDGVYLALTIVPLPPLQVQARIIDEVQFRLTVNEELEKLIEDNLKRAERLRQSILSSAFSGKIIN
ncbi:MAG: hypothetical protein RBT80_24685, partial [Candidatus Vecturithrix sp.]|nr:hypothetical protein [Candidatus Vecturithrix sp.]